MPSWWEMTGLPSSPIATDVNKPTESVVSRVTLVPDEHSASAHTYNSNSPFVPSVWEMTGLPSSPIATDV